MRRSLRWLAAVLLVAVIMYLGGVAEDRQELRDKILRLHVIGASDDDLDQDLKLRVRDAVLQRLDGELSGVEDKWQALQIVRGLTDELAEVADLTLAQAGSDHTVTVSVGEAEFPRRDYDTFRLPAGVYDALKITIGAGRGRNWWCVVFPELCIPAATAEVDAVAAGAGFSRGARGALTGEYEVRYYVLDLWGRIENFFWSR